MSLMIFAASVPGNIAYAAGANPDLQVTVPSNNVNVGDTFIATVELSNLTQFKSAQFTLYFDPAKLQVVKTDGTPATFATGTTRRTDLYNSVELTGVFSQTGMNVNNTTGLVDYSLYIDPAQTDMATSSYPVNTPPFMLLQIRFKAMAAGNPNLQFAVQGVSPQCNPANPTGYIAFAPNAATCDLVVPTMNIADPAAITAALAAVNGATEATIAQVLVDNNAILGLDLAGDYAVLADKAPVHTALVGKNFVDVAAVVTAFNTAVANQKAVETALAAVNAATVDTIAQVLSDNSTVLGLVLTDYNALVDKAPVHVALVGQNFANIAAVKTAFDNAVSAQKAVEASAAEAATAVVNAENLVAAGLDTQAKIDAAQTAHDNAATLVNALADGTVKTNLNSRLTAVQTDINTAQAELTAITNATNAVAAAEAKVTAGLDTQAKIDAAQADYNTANPLVVALSEGPVKASLTTRLADVQTAINTAQAELTAIINATNAVVAAEAKVTAGLETQAKIDAASTDYNTALPLVNALSASATKTDLTNRLAAVNTAIVNAQTALNMTTFTIGTTGGDLGIIKTPGISAKVTVTPSAAGRNAVVIFQLMNGTTPVSIVALERNIASAETFTAQFPGYTGTNYSVKVFVWDTLSNSTTSVGANYAQPQTLN